MSTMVAPQKLWSAMPGWGIYADLTPPELVNSRRLKSLRKVIVVALVALLVLCAGGYVLAARKSSAASNALADVQLRTSQLQGQAHKYSGVTQLQGTVTQVQTQIATLMSGDVDLVKLIGQLRSTLPATMTIKQEAVTISVAGVAGAATSNSGNGLDTSGHPQIGTVTLSGAAKSIDDLSAYTDALKSIPGITNVLPLSNATDSNGVQYSLSLGLTDLLLSHRFDTSKNGGK
jgi:Tfp pilus assembly protein PilN